MMKNLENIIKKREKPKFKLEKFLLETISYPVVGALPAEIRYKIQNSKYLTEIIKKNNLDYMHKATEIQTILQALMLPITTTVYVSNLTGGEFNTTLTTAVLSYVFSLAGACIRHDLKDDKNYYIKANNELKELNKIYPSLTSDFGNYFPRGSFIFEWPYRLLKNIKNASDYIKKRIIKTHNHLN